MASSSANKPRCYLFQGNDSYTSSRTVKKWVQEFKKKYADGTVHTLEADELEVGDLIIQALTILQANSLFSAPRLLIIKQVASFDKGPGCKNSKALVGFLDSQRQFLSEEITIVIWESKQLGEKQAVLEWFTSLQATHLTKIYSFSVPNRNKLAAYCLNYVESEGYSLEKPALAWIEEQFRLQEEEMRYQLRLKQADSLSQDYRTWWLQALLDGAIIRAKTALISLADISYGSETILASPPLFPFAQAAVTGNFKQAKQLVQKIHAYASQDEGIYFSVFAALKWQCGKFTGQDGGLVKACLFLLAETELISKNGFLEPAWLLDMLLYRLLENSQGKKLRPIVEPKRLWLAHYARS